MIVKRNLNPVKVLSYVRAPLAYAAVVAIVVVLARRTTDSAQLVVPFAPVGTLGAALAIFVAFRNNASYARWWEARTVWGNIHNNARILARQLVASTDNALASGTGGSTDDVLAYRREQALRIIAFAHALRIELRGTGDWERLRPYLPSDEFRAIVDADGRSNLLLQRLGVRIKDGVRLGLVGQFDPITLEPNLAALNGWAAASERIEQTPTPRQYDYFTRVAIAAFSTLLPFGLESVVPTAQEWLVVVLSIVVAGVFIILERVGAIVDAPFSNTNTDIPMTAICTAIERDLLEQIGDADRPPAAVAVDGYLW
ncbi:MAG: bestrophin family protein [Acidimicrobiales bacterium]